MWLAAAGSDRHYTHVLSPGLRWGWRWWLAGRQGWWIWVESPTSCPVQRCGRCDWFWSTWQSKWWPCQGPAGGAGMHKPPHLVLQSSGRSSGRSGRYLWTDNKTDDAIVIANANLPAAVNSINIWHLQNWYDVVFCQQWKDEVKL